MKFIFFVSLIFLPELVFPWHEKTHYRIVDVLKEFIPNNLKEKIDLEEFKKGSVAPDMKEYKQVFTYTHYYHLHDKSGGAIDAIVQYVEDAKKLFRGEKTKQASFILGAALHYLADLNMPLNTAQENWETAVVFN
ncbi:MAG: zinc dependent phospholipase C family protein, partial [Bacteroidales bacterium]